MIDEREIPRGSQGPEEVRDYSKRNAYKLEQVKRLIVIHEVFDIDPILLD